MPQQHEHKQMPMMSWTKFAAMITVSTVIMFGLMYQAVYRWDHAEFSQTRVWSAVVMGTVMGIIMLGFMWSMFPGRGTKIGVLLGLVVAGLASLWLVRSQETVGDVSFMKAMIPHHSIAIANARKAQITDPRVRRLADNIIRSQVREITEMKMLSDDIQKNGSRGNAVLPATAATLTPDMQPQIMHAVQ